jgi:hypothetical protein
MIDFSSWRLDRDLIVGLKQGCLIGVAAAVLILPPAGSATSRLTAHRLAATQSSAALPPHRPHAADLGEITPSDDAKYIANWVADSGDNTRLAFAILDKRDARVYVFDADARLIGASPVLLGVAPGDDSVAGIGQRPINEVRPEERTTPAGRFASSPGRNASGEDVVWVDYADAVSMHRVRPVDPKERRLERLASPDPAQRRISYGCINVPVAFFNAVVHPTLAAGSGVVYVLPERKSIQETFASSYAVKEQVAQLAADGSKRQ